MENQRGTTAKPQARQKHPDQWQQDLNPGHLAGQNIGPPTDEIGSSHMTASSEDAYAPKDRVPYEIWNRLIGEPKPGQE